VNCALQLNRAKFGAFLATPIKREVLMRHLLAASALALLLASPVLAQSSPASDKDKGKSVEELL
jgi:hypothetical protein